MAQGIDNYLDKALKATQEVGNVSSNANLSVDNIKEQSTDSLRKFWSSIEKEVKAPNNRHILSGVKKGTTK